MNPARSDSDSPDSVPRAVAVVGIGADGWDGLPETSRAVLLDAEVLIGGARHLTLLPAACRGERIPWPSPLRPAVRGLFAAHAGRRITVLASGDPMFYGIGRTLIEELGAGAVHVLPHPSSVSYACARLGRPLEDTDVATLVGRPTARLAAAPHHGRRLLVLSADAATPGQVAALLRDRGFGPSRMRLLEQLCGKKECATAEGAADDWPHPPRDPLNIVAVEVRRALKTDRPRLGAVPGLPDAAYEHDGQLTPRHVRAAGARRARARARRVAVGHRRRVADGGRRPRSRPGRCRARRRLRRGAGRGAGAAAGPGAGGGRAVGRGLCSLCGAAVEPVLKGFEHGFGEP